MSGVGCFGFLDGVFSPHPWEGEHAVKTQKAEGPACGLCEVSLIEPLVAPQLWYYYTDHHISTDVFWRAHSDCSSGLNTLHTLGPVSLRLLNKSFRYFDNNN